MKPLPTTILLTFFSISAIAQNPFTPKVDERIELTGVVFRLAGIPEYSAGEDEEYNNDIDEYFKKYQDDRLIEYIRQLRKENALGYAAVAASSLHLEISDGNVIVCPYKDVSTLAGIGGQWKDEKVFKKYVSLLDDFYKRSDFHTFFIEHKDTYDRYVKSASSLTSMINPQFFNDFYGIEFVWPDIYVAVNNGKSNYFIGDLEDQNNYSIIIGGRKSYIIENMLPVIIHEICHNYSNPICTSFWGELQDAFDICLSDTEVTDKLASIGYKDKFGIALEWFTNLCTAMYLEENIPLLTQYYVSRLRDNGYIWMPRCVNYMGYFRENQEHYSTIQDFMPQLVLAMNEIAKNYDKIKSEAVRRPYIADIYPANGSDISKFKGDAITIRFSEDMSPYSFAIGQNPDISEGAEVIPRKGEPIWKDSRSFLIPIDTTAIKSGKEYYLYIGSQGFVTPDYRSMEGGYIITYSN